MAINSNKFFDSVKQDVTVSGTLFGRRLTKEERIEGHKTKDPIKFKSFVAKVLNKKGGNGGSDITGKTLAPVPNQRLLPGAREGDEPIPAGLDSLLEEIRGEGKKKRKKSLLDWVKQINTRVGGIITILTKQSNIDKDNADKERQELEKDARADRESGREGKPKMGLPGPVKAMLKPVSGLWENILKTIGILFKGWALNNFLKWLGDPKNAENVKAFTDLIVRNIPNALKAIGVIVGAGLITKLITFTAGIIAGSLRMVNALFTLGKTIFKFGKNMLSFTGGKQMAQFFGMMPGANAAFEMQQKEIEKSLSDKSLANVKEDIRGMNVITGDEIKGAIQEELSARENFNEGGVVPGSGNSDTVPAMLTPGEFVMSAGAVNEWGLGTLANMNAVGGGNNSPQYMGGTLFANGGGPVDGIAKSMIKIHEGLRLSKYLDSRGLPTIGYGHLVEDGENFPNRITKSQAEALFLKDYEEHKAAAQNILGYDKASPKQKAALIDLTFNMGPGWAAGFPKFRKAFAAGDYNTAANELIDSDWFKQVKTRGPTIVDMIRGSGSKDRTSNQLINNPPGRHGRSTTMKLPPLTPPPPVDGDISSGGAVPTEPMFSPHDKSNHYTLLNGSMCNILGSK